MENTKTGRIITICRSDKRGTAKYELPEARLIPDWGIEGDAHAGHWHRQVSLLGFEKIEDFRARGSDVEFGAFGENLVVEGFDLRNLPVGTTFTIGEAELILSQIGKDCHDHCAIYDAVGDCIMPREGVFTEVVRGGIIRTGDEIVMHPPSPDRPLTAAVIASGGEACASRVKCAAEGAGFKVLENFALPEGGAKLRRAIVRLADQRQVNLVLVLAGSSSGADDLREQVSGVTREESKVPGVAAGIRGRSLILVLPGGNEDEASAILRAAGEIARGLRDAS